MDHTEKRRENVTGNGEAGVEQEGMAAGGSLHGPIKSREQAFRGLREIAEFLRRTEPHSPVAPLIDRAIKWGNMSFTTLFTDVVKNPEVRNQVLEVLGLTQSEEP